MKRSLLALAELAALSASAVAADWYVSDTGSDAAAGTESAPFASLAKALSAAADEGDVIHVGPGTFEVSGEVLEVTKAVTVTGAGIDRTTVKAVNSENAKGITDAAGPYRRCFFVNNAAAVVENLTMTNGRWYNYGPNAKTSYDTGGVCGGGDLVLYKGTVRNCRITGTDNGTTSTCGGTNGGGVWMSGGELRDCTIDGCRAQYNNNGSGVGGGLWMSGGTAAGCTITGNVAGQFGSGVYIKAGVLTNCLVSANRGISPVTGAVYVDGTCTVADCRITGHDGATHKYAGLYMNGDKAKVFNLLIDHNSGVQEGAGAYVLKGTLANCTIVDNSSVRGLGMGPGLLQKGGSVLNCVIARNGGGVYGDACVSAGTFGRNLTEAAVAGVAPEAGNLVGDPIFADAGNGDYRPAVGSKAIGAAEALDWVVLDHAGVVRPASPTIGAFEHVASETLVCSFNIAETSFAKTGGTTIAASVEGASGDVSYTWFFDGVAQELTSATVEWADIPIGAHTVKLVVSDGASSAEFERRDAISVLSDHTYVSASGGNVYPYDTEARAAHRVQDAIDACACSTAAPGTVTVLPGDYPVGGMWNRLVKPVRLVAKGGAAVTTLRASDPNGATYDGKKICRVLYLSDAQASVEGFTITGGWWYSAAGDSGPGGMRMSAGTVTNCVFTGNRGGDLGGAVQMSGGRLVDCRIYGNWARYNNDGCNTYGGGVYMTGGEISGCVVSNNWAALPNGASGTGCGVWMSGGTLRDSLLADNYAKATGVRGVGLAISGGLAERCTITNNSTRMTVVYNGGGVWISGGTLRNSLVAGNRCQQKGGGIYQTGGTVEFVTVAKNTSDTAEASGLYVDGKTAVTRFCVLAANGKGVEQEATCNVKVGANTLAANFVKNVTVVQQGGGFGTGTICDDPLFVRPEAFDFTLGAGSPAIDAAENVPEVVVDLAGDERPKRGNAESAEALSDCGCYEAADVDEGPLRGSFTPVQVMGHDRLVTHFAVTVNGGGDHGELVYTWNFGAGVVKALSADGAEADVEFAVYGEHTVSVTVTPERGEPLTLTNENCVRIGAAKIYLDAHGTNPVWPYNTPETAATDLEAAIDSAVSVVGRRLEFALAEGDYPIRTKWLIFKAPVWLHGTGDRAQTRILANPALARASNGEAKVLCLGDDGALVENVTLKGGRWEGNSLGDYGGAVRVTAGTLRNCILDDNEGGNQGGQLDMSGGLVTDCLVTNGMARSFGNNSQGQGTVYVTGGVLRNSVIVGNRAYGAAGGLLLAGGCVSNCVIEGNAAYYSTGNADRPAGGVKVEGGLMTHCAIRGNGARGDYGGVWQTGGEVRNCLVVGNWSWKTVRQGVGVTGAGAVFVNNTVVANGCEDFAATGIGANLAAGTVRNSVFWGSLGADVANGGADVGYCLIGGDPKFRNPSRGDYRFRGQSSPCYNAGTPLDWMSGATDLKGASRVMNGAPDIGCYEMPQTGLQLIVW